SDYCAPASPCLPAPYWHTRWLRTGNCSLTQKYRRTDSQTRNNNSAFAALNWCITRLPEDKNYPIRILPIVGYFLAGLRRSAHRRHQAGPESVPSYSESRVRYPASGSKTQFYHKPERRSRTGRG